MGSTLDVNSCSSMPGLECKVQPFVISTILAWWMQKQCALFVDKCLVHNLMCSSSPIWAKYMKLLTEHSFKSSFLCRNSCWTKTIIINLFSLSWKWRLETFKIWASSCNHNQNNFIILVVMNMKWYFAWPSTFSKSLWTSFLCFCSEETCSSNARRSLYIVDMYFC